MSRTHRVLPLLAVLALLLGACAQPVDGRPGTPAAASAAPDPVGAVASSASPVLPTAAATEPPAPQATTAPPATPAATATAKPVVAAVAAKPAPYKFNLYETGDFVPQYTFEWCVGASLQMMLNLVDVADPDSRARQERLWELARDLSSSPFGGANPRGWTAALNKLGVGRYELVSIPRYGEALRVAAKALRETKRPVGLVMWHGRHAWVMSGFTSIGNPRKDKGFRVTGIRVLDPLYPHGSSVWGASPRPNRLLTPKKLAQQFVRRDNRNSRVNLGVGPGFLLVLPV
jgi:hypothetical protein